MALFVGDLATYHGRIFLIPFFLLLDSFWFVFWLWLDDAGCVLSVLLLSVDGDDASAGALGSVGLVVGVFGSAVPLDVDSPVAGALGSSVVDPAGAGSPGFTTLTTPGLFAGAVPPLGPPADAPALVPTSPVCGLPPVRTSTPD